MKSYVVRSDIIRTLVINVPLPMGCPLDPLFCLLVKSLTFCLVLDIVRRIYITYIIYFDKAYFKLCVGVLTCLGRDGVTCERSASCRGWMAFPSQCMRF